MGDKKVVTNLDNKFKETLKSIHKIRCKESNTCHEENGEGPKEKRQGREREREKNRGRHGFAVVDDADQRAIVDDRFVQELHPIGMTIDKEELKKKLLMPQYLRFAMRDSIRLKDPSAGESRLPGSRDLVATATAENEDQTPPESPMVVFINPRSGGRHGPMLKERLQMLMGEEQLTYGLGWHIVLSMPAGTVMDPPHSLKATEECTLDEVGLEIQGDLPEKAICHEGVFYNYFSIGMDAQVAYGFHHLRNEKPYLAQGPISNKLVYSGYSCTQGWFFTPCTSDPGLRGLKNILRMHVKKVNCSEWEQIPVPSSVRAIVVLNLHSYGSGRNPWGNLKPEYLEKKGFVEAHADDGLLEIFGLKQGWHASFVMVELISAKHIAQAAAIRLEVRGGEWRNAYMQMDGEPWKQPMHEEFSTLVEIKRVPFQSLMIHGDNH
ncbi:diacylglycerol kinase 7 [Prunus dulcis]|uniref:Diacylglycerol kinase 7 n=1 Tax=Prunus dulcis TaxID=3755 RepID=A0A4Y1QM14_PRUDU|nr:diacylglycerol kinase 7 [Prunus dulcis]